MANPQKENGYIAIANEIFKAFCKFRINGEARQVLDLILTKTYGFNKQEDCISLSQFSAGTGLKKNTVCKAINKLKELNLITQKGNDIASLYRFNKDFETWKPLPKKGILPKKGMTITQKGKKYSPIGDIQKTVSKDTLTKDIGEPQKNEINLLLDFFKKTVNEHINFGNKTEREASKNLIEKYGLEKTKEALLFLEDKRKADKYLPIITTPFELWTKWAKIKQHLQTKKRKIWTPNTSHLLPSLQAVNTK